MAQQKLFQILDGTLLIDAPEAFDSVSLSEMRAIAISIGDDAVKTVIVELSRTTFLDSAGVGMIVKLFREAKGRAKAFSIRGATAQPLALLDSLQVRRAIPLE